MLHGTACAGAEEPEAVGASGTPLAPAACSAACSAAPGVTPRLPSCCQPRGGPGTASRLLSRNEEALHLPRRRGQRTAPAVKLEAGGTPPHGPKTANNAARHGG